MSLSRGPRRPLTAPPPYSDAERKVHSAWGERIAAGYVPADRGLGRLTLANCEVISTPEELLAKATAQPPDSEIKT